MRRSTPSPEIAILLGLIDEAYDRKAWHGPNLKDALRGVSAEDASWRPAPGRHNAWELAVHAAYWKYAVWRRLTGEKRRSFPLRGSNYFRRPIPGRTFAEDVALLDAEHRRLRATVSSLSPAGLGKSAAGSRQKVGTMVAGIALHDVYHAAQIRLVRSLRTGAR
jgi:DinB superfamily